mmetsp:Transcript_27966/g.76893  ORF Transcript_27966/g.76893 Transcript_27966/m.76893 type:complete len:208 (+) Transcript_27966:229-852(+)
MAAARETTTMPATHTSSMARCLTSEATRRAQFAGPASPTLAAFSFSCKADSSRPGTHRAATTSNSMSKMLNAITKTAIIAVESNTVSSLLSRNHRHKAMVHSQRVTSAFTRASILRPSTRGRNIRGTLLFSRIALGSKRMAKQGVQRPQTKRQAQMPAKHRADSTTPILPHQRSKAGALRAPFPSCNDKVGNGINIVDTTEDTQNML